jgi:ubiquinone biosynthesis protein
MHRLIEITQVFLKYDLEDFLVHLPINNAISFGINLKKLFFQKKRTEPLEVRFRLALEELGPVFIKLGQLLATRKGLLPKKFSKELESLRDNVNASYIDVDKVLGEHLSDFEFIKYKPIASASIAQVYEAKLKQGDDVVIKILRSNVKETIIQDLEVFKLLIKLYKFSSEYKSNIFHGILLELEESLIQEIDLTNEAKNAKIFAENMKDFSNVLVPKIYDKYCNPTCIVMEKMYGTPIDKIDIFKDKGFDLHSLSVQGLEIFIIQVIRNRFFHADFHPGNIWIDDQGRRIFLDFGIMGSLTKEDRDLLTNILSSVYKKNYDKFIELFIEAGWADEKLDKESFKKQVETIITQSKSPFNSLNEILQLGELFGIKVPVRFTLLGKTCIISEAIAKTLNPKVNLSLEATSIFLKHFKKYIN